MKSITHSGRLVGRRRGVRTLWLGCLVVPSRDDPRELRVEVAVTHRPPPATVVRRGWKDMPKPVAASGRTVTVGLLGRSGWTC